MNAPHIILDCLVFAIFVSKLIRVGGNFTKL